MLVLQVRSSAIAAILERRPVRMAEERPSRCCLQCSPGFGFVPLGQRRKLLGATGLLKSQNFLLNFD